MKRISLVSLITCLALTVHAQVSSTRKPISLDSNSVVKDSTGRVLAFSEWQPIIASGMYTLKFRKPAKNDSVEYTLFPLSDDQIDFRMSIMPQPRESKFFKTGEKISNFYADDMNGKGFKLKKLEGKVVVLNFWFIGCPPCRMEIPELNKIAKAYANDPDVVFISFGLDGYRDIKNYISYVPFTYHIVYDARPYADAYHINLYPTNVVLDKEGKVRFHSSGYATNLPYWIRKTIEECKKY